MYSISALKDDAGKGRINSSNTPQQSVTITGSREELSCWLNIHRGAFHRVHPRFISGRTQNCVQEHREKQRTRRQTRTRAALTCCNCNLHRVCGRVGFFQKKTKTFMYRNDYCAPPSTETTHWCLNPPIKGLSSRWDAKLSITEDGFIPHDH